MLPTGLRHSLRALRKKLSFTLAAVLCIALGVGAISAIFSVADPVLLRPLPFAEADRLVMLWDLADNPASGLPPEQISVSPPNFAAWQEQATSFDAVEALAIATYNLTGDGEPQRVLGARVTAALFPMLGVEPILGRTFTQEEDQRGSAAKVAMLGHDLWRRAFAGDDAVLGEDIEVDGESYRIVGVMPASFGFPELPNRSEIWLPLGLDPDKSPERGWHYLFVAARLAPGVSQGEAQAEMDRLAENLAAAFPETNAGWGVAVLTLREWLVGDVKPVLVVLLAAVAFVLLIACANVASLLLARGEDRASELATRLALGARRGELVRLLLTESLLLALIGGALGLLLATWSLGALVALAPASLPELLDLSINWRVALVTFLVSALVGVATGLVPVARLSRVQLRGVLQEGSQRAGSGGGGRRLLNALVVAEVAVSLVLLTGAALALGTLRELADVDPGFNPAGALTFRVSLPEESAPAQRIAFHDEVLESLGRLPGVKAVGATSKLPIDQPPHQASFTVEDFPPTSPTEDHAADVRRVSPGYLPAMGTRLVEGRLFNSFDRDDTEGVAMVSERMVRQYWRGQSPLGKRIKRGGPDSEDPWLTVVGVVEDMRDYGLAAEIRPAWYLPYPQNPLRGLDFVLRTDGDPLALANPARQALWAVNRDLPIYHVMTLEERTASSLARQRFSTLLLGLFAAVGLALAAVGIYGIMSYSVSQRTGELGIRLALGGQPGDMLRLVLGHGAVLTGIGVLLGAAGALALHRGLASQLAEIGPLDPWVLVSIAVALTLVALAACYAPARRATRVDPVRVMKAE